MEQPVTERLFVYGTLRKDVPHSRFHLLMGGTEYIGLGQVNGRLFQLGSYPGLIVSDEAQTFVRGEVYALASPIAVLRRLDRYEGCGPDDRLPHLFQRVETQVLMDIGGTCRAWVYVYNGSTIGRQEITSGDYASKSFEP